MRNLKASLADVSPGNDDIDHATWRWEENGRFTITSAYEHDIDGGLKLPYSSLVWENHSSSESLPLHVIGSKRVYTNIAKPAEKETGGPGALCTL